MNAIFGITSANFAGRLTDLTEIEASAVVYLRLWYSGLTGKAKVQQNLQVGLGPQAGAQATQAFEQLCFFAVQHGKSAISPNGLSCMDVNCGEAQFANLIANAAFGQIAATEDLASDMVGEDAQACIAELAEVIGRAFCQIRDRARTNWQSGTHPIHRPH